MDKKSEKQKYNRATNTIKTVKKNENKKITTIPLE